MKSVENEWSIFKVSEYKLVFEPAKNTKKSAQHVAVNNFKIVDSNNKTLVILKLSKGFSMFTDEDEVLDYINCLFHHYSQISSLVDDPDFANIPTNITSNDELAAMAVSVRKELDLRKQVIEIHGATEYSMCEFISPLLIGSVNLMVDYLKAQQTSNEKLSLSCEKQIVGNVYQGPVDYVVVFDCLDIVLTEAKKDMDLKKGVLQNLLH